MAHQLNPQYPNIIVSILFLNVASIVCIPRIYNIETSFISPDDDLDALQLNITWKHDVYDEKNSSFNIKVKPIGLQTDQRSCNVYGVLEIQEGVVIPENVQTNLDITERECVFTPDTTYIIEVETSKGRIINNSQIYIPDCIFDHTCQCRHNKFLPKPKIQVERFSENTLNVQWIVPEFMDQDEKHLIMSQNNQSAKLSKLEIQVSNLTNPTLSWGGLKRTISTFEIDLHKESTYSNNSFIGSTIVSIVECLNTCHRFEIIGNVVDDIGCSGNNTVVNLKLKTIEPDNLEYLKILVPSVLILMFFFIMLYNLISRRLRKDTIINNVISIPLMQTNGLYHFTTLEEKYEFDRNQLDDKSIQIIGSGQYGTVSKMIWKTPNELEKYVAVKTIRSNNSEDLKDFEDEITIFQKVGYHRNIVYFYGYCTEITPFLLVMEYINGGDLKNYLFGLRNNLAPSTPIATENLKLELRSLDTDDEMRKQNATYGNCTQSNLRPSVTETEYTYVSLDSPSTENEPNDIQYELHTFAIQICDAMRYLEHKNIVHRDLAARNILINDKKVLKITDFGLSKDGMYRQQTLRPLPLRWLSVESIKTGIYSHKSDVWSYAIVLWEIATLGNVPYADLEPNEVKSSILERHHLEKPINCTDEMYDLMTKCWSVNPSMRPSFQEIFEWLTPLKKSVYVNFKCGTDYILPMTPGVDDSAFF